MEWIRNHYNVPTKRGAFINYTGDTTPQKCQIKSAKNGKLVVEVIATGNRLFLHPTWEVEYL